MYLFIAKSNKYRETQHLDTMLCYKTFYYYTDNIDCKRSTQFGIR